MLDTGDREYIKGLLILRLTNSGALRQTLVSYLPQDLAQQVGEGMNPATLVERVLALCEADGWRRTPTAMANLLSYLGNTDRVPQILAKLAAAPAAAPDNDPFTASILDTGQPFLDRLPTRTVLRTWTEPLPIKQVMVVDGPPKTGKSYTVEYVRHIIRHVASSSGQGASDVRWVLVSLERDQAASCGQGELATELVDALGGDTTDMPTSDTNTTAWTKQLVTRVLREANSRGLRWWFVLDSFRSSRPGEHPPWQLREDTRDFIIAFVKGLTNGINTGLHRLLLLDFDRAILPLAPQAVGLDKTCSIPHAAVTALVRSIIASSGKALDPVALEAEVMSDLADPVDNLPELNERLIELMGLGA